MATWSQTALGAKDRGDACPIRALSREMLELIFEYVVHETSPPTLAALTLTSKAFYATVYPLKYRHQNFTFKEDMKDVRSKKSSEVLRRLLTDPAKEHILRSIRFISIKSIQKPGTLRVPTLYDRSYKESHENIWFLMADLISKLPHLKSFTLQGTDQLSIDLLNTLEKCHPQAHLHIRNWTRTEDDEDHTNSAEIALARSPNLKSLQARLSSTTSPIDLRQDALQRIVAISPNLEILDISQEPSNRMIRNTTMEEQQEQTWMREEFCKTINGSSNSIRALRSRGTHNITILKDVIDMTNLHTLDVGYLNTSGDVESHTSISQWQGNNFPYLRHFSFALNDSTSPEFYGFLSSFLQTCAPLESLSIRDGAKYIPLSIISSHGATLRRLVLHEVESATSYFGWSISVRDVQRLSESCRVLEDITIDARKTSNGQGLNEILSTLATFPLLHTIRIYIPLGVAEEAARTPHIFLDEYETSLEIEAHRKKPFNPIEDSCWLENAWSLLRHEKKKSGSTPVKELHVKVGEWEREMSGGYPAGWVIWEAANRRYFIATPHERDDRPDDINMYIKGTKPYSYVNSHEIRRIPDFAGL
ncbi:hypothetical protein D0Z07_1213 [Hyphodiscus hymeniophilus]|uniref:F-box domain-containing protein n=1 Tax=Hyphodiscus hymeniophilus TaxID=353542 RepID=A0A9P6VQV9_9HELO|nr:hypothetical protein D0Z07_1213 [Hyphodiscus hymeniophilus]